MERLSKLNGRGVEWRDLHSSLRLPLQGPRLPPRKTPEPSVAPAS